VEDNSADVFLIRRAIEIAGSQFDIHVARDGEQAIQYIDTADAQDSIPCPAVVILDINLPKKHGGEVLQHLRNSSRCGGTPVIAISTSDAQRDRDTMARLGANAYFRKPSDYHDFMKLHGIVAELLRDSV
jgi:CheY-like chemotaxis protein